MRKGDKVSEVGFAGATKLELLNFKTVQKMNNEQNVDGFKVIPAIAKPMLCEVAYEKCQLVAKKEQVYTADGKYMFSVSMTDRAKALLENEGWEKGKESWLDYRQRTEAERELEKQKQYKLAADLADAFNRMYGSFA